MIIKSIEIEQFRAFRRNSSFKLGKQLTAISGRNATQKTTVLGMIGQPFTISKGNPMYGCKTIDGYNFRSQFKEKFKISKEHDTIGEHKWRINLYKGVYKKEYFSVESIPRKQGKQEPTLRFWNSEDKSSGSGYIQLPVYFLSLSRLFPIGESGKTKHIPSELNESEIEYCIKNYRQILSIQKVPGVPTVGIEKGTSSRTFSGVSDDVHDIFTNSAGEGNVTKIILAVLSFKRLKEQYGNKYKGGILLIDELDATLHGFSQEKLVDFLWEASKENKIQIIFTTHSPIILKRVNWYLQGEKINRRINDPQHTYSSAIVYLEPEYNDQGLREIMTKNVFYASELKRILNDINLFLPIGNEKIRVYCEDERAASFLKYILSQKLQCNLELYMEFVDASLGWTNYIHLYKKGIPEFKNNVIVLDGDVPENRDYKKVERDLEDADNLVFLPLVIEKDLFKLLKNCAAFNRFRANYSNVPEFSYELCFNEWPLETDKYDSNEYKKWFRHIEKAVGREEILFTFWCDENPAKCDEFSKTFVKSFNCVARRVEADALLEVGGNQTADDNS